MAKTTEKIKLHKDQRNYEDVFVSVNGRKFMIQRGVEVEVPVYVAEVIANSEREDNMAYERRMAMENVATEKGKQ